MSLHDVLQGFRLSDCNEWLDQPERTFVRQTPGVTDALKRQVLLEQFIFWFFESFVLSLIKVSLFNYLDHRELTRITIDYFLCYGIIRIQESSPILPT